MKKDEIEWKIATHPFPKVARFAVSWAAESPLFTLFAAFMMLANAALLVVKWWVQP